MSDDGEGLQLAKNPPSPAIGGPRKRALDPFFIFTYSLLALAGAIQFLVMVWMDLF